MPIIFKKHIAKYKVIWFKTKEFLTCTVVAMAA